MKTDGEVKMSGAQAKKQFDLRRAELLPKDESADLEYLSMLVVIERPRSRQAPAQARPLTAAEAADVRVGRVIPGREILLREVWEQLEAERQAWARARFAGKSRGLQDQIKRLEAETHDRFGVDPA